MNSKLELQWDNACQQCCAKSTKALRERIHATDVEQNQIRTVQYLLINKLAQLKMIVNLKREEILNYLIFFPNGFLIPVKMRMNFHRTDVDRTPWDFKPAWDEPYRLPPRNRQCGICVVNMKPRGDSWICRKCGKEEIDL